MSIYFKDPDENGVEIYYDHAPEKWPHDEAGNPVVLGQAFNLDTLLSEPV